MCPLELGNVQKMCSPTFCLYAAIYRQTRTSIVSGFPLRKPIFPLTNYAKPILK